MSSSGFARHETESLSTTSSVRPAVLVTGASGGIGRAVSHAFGQAGWYVGVHYCRNKSAAETTLQDVISSSGTGELYEADVREAALTRNMIAHFRQQTLSAPSTAMICAAGIAFGT